MGITRRGALSGLAAFAGLTAVARGASAQSMRLRLTHHRVPWSGAKRFRVAQVTDVHVGWGTPVELLAQVTEACWKAEPDLVALTGDYVNRSLANAEALQAFVRSLPKPLIATLGNHDHWSGAEAVARVLRAGGAEVLQNGQSGIEGIGHRLEVIGVDDGFTKHDDVEAAFRGISAPEAALVLSHYPATALAIAERGAGLVISGHTHGGQIAVPILTEALMSLIGNPFVQGWYQLQETPLYVSAGVGQSLDGLRGGASATAEIAIYDLDPAARTRESRTHRLA